jgi:hypothetical protein
MTFHSRPARPPTPMHAIVQVSRCAADGDSIALRPDERQSLAYIRAGFTPLYSWPRRTLASLMIRTLVTTCFVSGLQSILKTIPMMATTANEGSLRRRAWLFHLTNTPRPSPDAQDVPHEPRQAPILGHWKSPASSVESQDILALDPPLSTLDFLSGQKQRLNLAARSSRLNPARLTGVQYVRCVRCR